jgi:competence protein ComFC
MNSVHQLAWRQWLDAVVGLLYPNICQLCNQERAGASEGYVCEKCWHKVRFIRPPFCQQCGLPYAGDITTAFECSNCREMQLHFEFARAAVIASSTVLDVIHRYKYQRALWFEQFLADLLIRQAAPELATADWDFIVPVPLHTLKKREREFNQAERLAVRLSAATKIPLNPNLLARIDPTKTQTLLSREERALNVQKAFAFRANNPLNGERIVLVDDVLTTGATTSACAKVLRRNGSGCVCVWTVARGL